MAVPKLKRILNLNSSTDYKITLRHHVIFWIVYFVFNTLRWGSYYDDYLFSLKTNLLGFPIHILLSYFNIYYLMPKYVYKRKFWSFSVLILLALFVMLLVKYSLTYLLISHNVWPEGPEVTTQLTLNYAVTMMLGELYVISFATAIKVTIDWLRERKRLADLEKLQLETELRFLRTQISPHFFFNTLNNIYSLSIEKSDKAPQTILKLSELMRYLLYETKPRKQSIKKEIICLQNYLDLERIRYGDSLKIHTSISGDMEGKKIAPMLLLTFIENCFKHGANKNIGNVNIGIDLDFVDDFLHFKVSNTLPERNDAPQLLSSEGGIGINNVKKRLELGYLKDEYNLDIYEDDNLYVVELKIKVA